MKSNQLITSFLVATTNTGFRAVHQLLRGQGMAIHRRALCAMTLAAGMSLGATGCVSSTPGSLLSFSSRPSQQPITTDRLVSVARVFETQQNYGKAKQLYKLVLSQQPSNREAIQQIAWIDSLGTGIPAQNPRLGEEASSPKLYAEATYPTERPKNFVPQTVSAAVKTSRGPAIPVVFSGTDPATGQTYMLDSTGSLPTQEMLPHATLVSDSVSGNIVTEPVPVDVEYPIDESIDVNAFAEPVGTAILGNDDGIWAMPVSGTETSPATSIDDSLPELELQSFEQLSGTFEAPVEVATRADNQLGAIEQYVEQPEQSIPQLIQFLGNADSDVRSLAAFLIGETGWKGASALPALNQQLQAEQHDVIRVTIAESIAKLDSQSRAAFMVMSKCLESPEVDIRTQAAFALRVYAGAGHAECVRQLAASLTDVDPNVRSMAALSLGDFGPSAAEAIPAIEAAMNDQSSDVREAASAALARVIQK